MQHSYTQLAFPLWNHLISAADSGTQILGFYHFSAFERMGEKYQLSTEVSEAAQAGNVDLVIASLNSGLDVDARNVFQTCLLHIASKHGHLRLLNTLIAYGADVNTLDYVRKQTVIYKPRD